MIITGSAVLLRYCVIAKTLLILNGTAPVIQNTTIYNTETEVVATCTIQNSIGNNNLLPSVDIDIDAAQTVTGQNNCFKDAAKTGAGTYTDTDSLWSTDPLMNDPAAADFTLQAASPCIDAGDDVGLTEDYAGNPIIGIPDIGAFESQLERHYLIQNIIQRIVQNPIKKGIKKE